MDQPQLPDLAFIFSSIHNFFKTAPFWQRGAVSFFILIIASATSYDIYKRFTDKAYAEEAKDREEKFEKVFFKTWLKFMAIFAVVGVLIVSIGIYSSE